MGRAVLCPLSRRSWHTRPSSLKHDTLETKNDICLMRRKCYNHWLFLTSAALKGYTIGLLCKLLYLIPSSIANAEYRTDGLQYCIDALHKLVFPCAIPARNHLVRTHYITHRVAWAHRPGNILFPGRFRPEQPFCNSIHPLCSAQFPMLSLTLFLTQGRSLTCEPVPLRQSSVGFDLQQPCSAGQSVNQPCAVLVIARTLLVSISVIFGAGDQGLGWKEGS